MASIGSKVVVAVSSAARNLGYVQFPDHDFDMKEARGRGHLGVMCCFRQYVLYMCISALHHRRNS